MFTPENDVHIPLKLQNSHVKRIILEILDNIIKPRTEKCRLQTMTINVPSDDALPPEDLSRLKEYYNTHGICKSDNVPRALYNFFSFMSLYLFERNDNATILGLYPSPIPISHFNNPNTNLTHFEKSREAYFSLKKGILWPITKHCNRPARNKIITNIFEAMCEWEWAIWHLHNNYPIPRTLEYIDFNPHRTSVISLPVAEYEELPPPPDIACPHSESPNDECPYSLENLPPLPSPPPPYTIAPSPSTSNPFWIPPLSSPYQVAPQPPLLPPHAEAPLGLQPIHNLLRQKPKPLPKPPFLDSPRPLPKQAELILEELENTSPDSTTIPVAQSPFPPGAQTPLASFMSPNDMISPPLLPPHTGTTPPSSPFHHTTAAMSPPYGTHSPLAHSDTNFNPVTPDGSSPESTSSSYVDVDSPYVAELSPYIVIPGRPPLHPKQVQILKRTSPDSTTNSVAQSPFPPQHLSPLAQSDADSPDTSSPIHAADYTPAYPSSSTSIPTTTTTTTQFPSTPPLHPDSISTTQSPFSPGYISSHLFGPSPSEPVSPEQQSPSFFDKGAVLVEDPYSIYQNPIGPQIPYSLLKDALKEGIPGEKLNPHPDESLNSQFGPIRR